MRRIDGPPGPRRIAATDQVRALVAAAAALPGVREHRVAPLRQAIADDTYRVDPRAVASAILEQEDGLARR